MTTDANRLTARATSNAMAPEWSATISAFQLRVFVDALATLGFDTPALLAHCGLRRAELDDPDAVVPCAAMVRVLGDAAQERRMPNLGAHLASVTPIGAYPLLDYLVVTTDTVAGALDQLERYFHLVAAPCPVTVVHDETSTRLVVSATADAFGAQYQTAIAVHHLRAETEQRVRVSYVSLIHTPDDHRDLERLLGCPVRAPSAWNGIEFPRESMSVPLRRRDAALRRVLEGHVQALAVPSSGTDAHAPVASVRALLSSRLSRGVPDIRSVARQLTMAPRTLQRRLEAAGVTYAQLVDDTRREAAERLLADRSLAVSEIGYLLGYSEPSAFHRAFKRWHGVTPEAYRAALADSLGGRGRARSVTHPAAATSVRRKGIRC
jgi:AraC-like DNA-binding protein